MKMLSRRAGCKLKELFRFQNYRPNVDAMVSLSGSPRATEDGRSQFPADSRFSKQFDQLMMSIGL
jgi:hypothetical protein